MVTRENQEILSVQIKIVISDDLVRVEKMILEVYYGIVRMEVWLSNEQLLYKVGRIIRKRLQEKSEDFHAIGSKIDDHKVEKHLYLYTYVRV